MPSANDNYDRLGYFSEIVAADSRRKEFDIKNHSIIRNGIRPDFLFIGDSITHYWELDAYFNIPGQLIVNRGIGGDTTYYLNKRFQVDALQLNPKYCILGIGINDSIDLEGDYWKLIAPVPFEKVLVRAKENISEIIEKAKNSSTTLVLTSLLPISIKLALHETERKSFVCNLNQWLAATAKAENLIFINYYTATTYPGTNKLLDHITYDGLHPNARGYELMTAVLRNTLQKNNIII
jgi:lysophospholipase L1-like esterase